MSPDKYQSSIANIQKTAPIREPATLGITLDIARGLAALLVFFFHISAYIGEASPSLGMLARYGYMGVPIFFVISGYCMASSAHQSLRFSQPAGRFLHKRFLRIYPALWASIILVMAIPYLLAGVSGLKTGHFIPPVPQWLTFDFLDWLEFVTLTRVFFSDGHGLDQAFSPLNTVYWTLAIEFQFYVVIYLALLWRKWFMTLLAIITLSSLSVFIFPSLKNTGLFLGYWPMFALGLGLYFLLDKNYTIDRFGRAGKHLSLPLLISLFIIFIIFINNGQLEQFLKGIFNDKLFGFAACTAIALWLFASLEKKISYQAACGHALIRIPLKTGVFLGSISYSIYLLHPKIYQFPHMAARQLTTPDNPISVLTVIVGTIALAWIFHVYFERPFIARRPAQVSPSPRG